LLSLPGIEPITKQNEQNELSFPTHQIDHVVNFSHGNLLFITYQEVPEAHDIFQRFGKVFEQTYTRFLDLQKAEEQARESQIQLALERVRARTMAMQKSDELGDVAGLLFKQVNNLDIKTFTTGFNVWSEDNNSYEDYVTNPEGGFVEPYIVDTTRFSVFTELRSAKKRGEEFFVQDIDGEMLKEVNRQLKKFGEKQFEKILQDGFEFPPHQVVHFVFGSKVSLMFVTYERVPEAHDIFKRFGKVFEQTYTRFLDLQTAETQARESQIQLALERVRARTMAMQKSEELSETAFILFKQFKELGENPIQITIGIFNEEKNVIEFRITGFDGSKIEQRFDMHIDKSTLLQKFHEAWKEQQSSTVIELKGKELMDWTRYRQSIAGDLNPAVEITMDDRRFVSVAFFSKGLISFSKPEQIEKETIQILERFAGVFDQTYTRFLDLKRAEGQTREAEIELALERVRAKTMAMQNHSDLLGVTDLFAEQLTHLGFDLEIVNFSNGLSYRDWDLWVTSPTSETGRLTNHMIIPWIDHPYFQKTKLGLDNFKKGIDLNVAVFNKAEKDSFLDHLFTHTIFKDFSQESRNYLYSKTGFTFSAIFLKETWVSICKYDIKPFTDQQHAVLRRFANAFSQAYTRFLDLQKAEAQAREAEIELSLERVRAKTMAMHNSRDVADTAVTMFDELTKLGVETLRCGIGIVHEPNDLEIWAAKKNEDEKVELIIGHLDLAAHPMSQGVLDNWKKKEKTFSYELTGDDLINYYTQLNNSAAYLTKWDLASLPQKQFYHAFYFPEGTVSAFSKKQLPVETVKIFKRFAAVFGQTYRRFLDLQKAEAQAREAQIEAALERVRGRTLAMQKSDELAETAAVLFRQLIHLGIEPNRLYINIIKNENGEAEFWITDEDGSKVSMAYEDNMNSNPSFKKMFKGWKEQKKSLMIDMKGKELEDYFKYLNSIHVPFKGGLEQKRRLQYIAYFSKGFIGMASPDEQPEATMQLLERFAYVFNLTFTRFNDLQIAEAHALQAAQDLIEIKAAKKKAEDTLTELKATQTQLIQSEKMASLGELTAGIAHEIQNPLNFVNNFSEVNNELIIELVEEVNKGNYDEAKALANDIKDNEEKINHHGRRADAIVKGMLQHSRTSAGQKEPIDINKLADEYLRLAYHGLRAKDKSFNTEIVTDFDESIGKINVVPQDIGRVLLNLFNNAFYAVNEKLKAHHSQFTADYKPLISIQTKRINDKVEVVVSDNGNGIPQNIVDKIFQPFFTTKPTGQGTGLGLSLAYDIIKAHSGEIKVETKEGQGSEFTILLPTNTPL
jgi:signal transduction histidine kinase